MRATTARHSLLPVTALLVLYACASQTGAEDVTGDAAQVSAADLTLAPPERGFQVETRQLVIEPGEDIRWCEVVQLPGTANDLYYVNRIESAMTAQSQDVILSIATPGSATEAAMETGARTPCTRAGEAFGEEVTELTSAQLGYHDQRYPQGVGHVLRGGQKLAVDYHSLNSGEERLAAQVKLNFHVVEAHQIAHLARTASFNNLTIYTPPGGRSSHLAECGVTQELQISELVRRTQSRGTRFRVWIAGGERDGELLWTSRGPNDTRVALRTPLHLQPGEGLRFQCDYANTTELELRYGVNASDEMCTLNASYWLPDEAADAEPQGCLLLGVDDDGVARK